MQSLEHTEQQTNEAAQMEKISSSLAASEHANNNELVASNQKVTFVAVFLGLVASIGGFM
jgi:hypothetical protein